MKDVFPVKEKSENFKILPESWGKVKEFLASQGKLDKKNKFKNSFGKYKNSSVVLDIVLLKI